MGAWRRPKLLFLHLKNHFPIFENLWARNTQVILLSLKLFSLICSPLFPCPFSSILLRLWTEKFQRPFCPPLESILVLERLLNYPKTEAGLKHSGNTWNKMEESWLSFQSPFHVAPSHEITQDTIQGFLWWETNTFNNLFYEVNHSAGYFLLQRNSMPYKFKLYVFYLKEASILIS